MMTTDRSKRPKAIMGEDHSSKQDRSRSRSLPALVDSMSRNETKHLKGVTCDVEDPPPGRRKDPQAVRFPDPALITTGMRAEISPA
jgi:hypothetical protein